MLIWPLLIHLPCVLHLFLSIFMHVFWYLHADSWPCLIILSIFPLHHGWFSMGLIGPREKLLNVTGFDCIPPLHSEYWIGPFVSSSMHHFDIAPSFAFFIIFLCYYFHHDSIIIRMCFTMKLGVDLSIMCLISLRTFVDFNSQLIENCYS